MSDEATRPGQVSATPEGGPIAEGVPGQEPGLGQVQSTPEAAPLSESDELQPPTWQEHMRGPILGTDGLPLGQEQAPAAASSAAEPAAAREEDTEASAASTAAPQSDEELRKWPPYTGKPVSEVRWDAARRYAAPIVAQAEKLTIKAIDLSGRGLSRLARYLEDRRQEREQTDEATRSRSQTAVAETSSWRGCFAPHTAVGVIQAAKTRPSSATRRPHFGRSPGLTAV